MLFRSRKRLNHRGPLSIDVPSAWYFVTVCADGHAPWVANIGRAVAPRPPTTTTSLDTIAPLILREARENHVRGLWHLALFLVMPDHLHFIVNIGGRGRPPYRGLSPISNICLPHDMASASSAISSTRGFATTRTSPKNTTTSSAIPSARDCAPPPPTGRIPSPSPAMARKSR